MCYLWYNKESLTSRTYKMKLLFHRRYKVRQIQHSATLTV